MAALCLLSLSARAGTYTPAYTTDGGVSYSSNGGALQTGNYQTQNNQFGYYARGNYGFGSPGKPNTGTATCSGTVTVTLTWKPAYTGELPPASVILTESCTAQWTVSKLTGATYTGQCNNGLGGTIVSLETASQWGQTCQNTQYTTVSNPGSSFTYTRTPSAGSSGSGYSAASSGSVYASMGYSAAASPVAVTQPTGITVDPNDKSWKVLTGQQLMASAFTFPSGFKLDPATKYAWSVTTPNPTKGQPALPADAFYNYDPNDAHTPLKQLYNLSDDPSYTTSSTFSFYDKSGENININCAVTMDAPDGTKFAGTALSQLITVVKPSANWTINPPQDITGYFIDTTNNKYGFNTVWTPVTITLPAPFLVLGGTGCFAQLWEPNRFALRHPNAGKPSAYRLQTSYIKPDGTQGWKIPDQGLDGQFPYVGTTNTTEHIWDVSTDGTSGDKPSQTYLPADQDQGGINWYSATTQDLFTSWLMYKPTSTNAVWVPLQKVSWGTNVTVSLSLMGWQISYQGAITMPTSGSPASDYPVWTVINDGAKLQMQP